MKRSQRLQNNAGPLVRFRVSVPEDDRVVLEWMSRQHNVSFSVRQLIREAVLNKGFCDAFANDLKDLEANEKKGRRSEKVMLKEIADSELPVPAGLPLNAKEPVSELSVSEPPALVVPVSEPVPVKNNLVENNLPPQEILNEEPPKQPHKAPSSAIEKLNEMVNL